jgi:hypothetical protein
MNGTMEQAIEAMKKLNPETQARIMEQARKIRGGKSVMADAFREEIKETVRAMTTADRAVVREVEDSEK